MLSALNCTQLHGYHASCPPGGRHSFLKGEPIEDYAYRRRIEPIFYPNAMLHTVCIRTRPKTRQRAVQKSIRIRETQLSSEPGTLAMFLHILFLGIFSSSGGFG